jgi:hypothetical protein
MYRPYAAGTVFLESPIALQSRATRERKDSGMSVSAMNPLRFAVRLFAVLAVALGLMAGASGAASAATMASEATTTSTITKSEECDYDKLRYFKDKRDHFKKWARYWKHESDRYYKKWKDTDDDRWYKKYEDADHKYRYYFKQYRYWDDKYNDYYERYCDKD